MRYKFTVPPTMEVGSYSGICSDDKMGSYQKDALWHYNSARAHDGLPPIKRMPNGTRYTPINTPVAYSVNSKDLFDQKKNPGLKLGARAVINNPAIKKTPLTKTWDLKSLNKLLFDKGRDQKNEVTRYKGEYYLLHILNNGRPVPLIHSKSGIEIKDYIEMLSEGEK